VRLQGQSLHLGKIMGQPVAIHLSLPIGLLFITGLRFEPGAWLAIIVLVLMHELGHGVLVKLRGGRVTSIMLHAFGGECAYVGATRPMDLAIIAWGGVLGQALAMPIAALVLLFVPVPQTSFFADFFGIIFGYNLVMIVINLLPLPMLDGGRAWGLIPLLRARANRR
jgi:stage IV sporulation protein FB